MASVEELKFTVEDVLQKCLPLGTNVVAGSQSLSRAVRWVISAAVDSPLPYLEGGELICLMPGKSDPANIIRACADANAAGVITLNPLTPLAAAVADAANMPVLQTPANTRIREIERTVVSLLMDQHDHIERRSIQIYEQLVQLASENAELSKIVHELARYMNKAVVLQDKRLRIQEVAIPPQLAANWDEITDMLMDSNLLPNSLRDRHRLAKHSSPAVVQPLNIEGLSRLITPIVNKDVGRGYLSFIAPTDSFDEIDTIVIDHGAVVCALEMARAKAISEMEKKLRGDFLDSLMLGTVSESEAMAEGDRFGHDMSVPHIAMVVVWVGEKHPSVRRLETLVNGLVGRQNNILLRLRENEVRLFYAVDTSSPVQSARELAEEIRSEARREYPDAKIAVGIGSIAAKINNWRTSYREASQAADIARRLQSESAMYIGDLGIYTFLAHPNYRDDLRTLRDSTIGNLIQYEERQRADLLLTLEAFFQCHGNHTQTAELLSVHRNTLFYRMNRIAEITGLDLNQPDVRLAVHLALKIHRLLTSET